MNGFASRIRPYRTVLRWQLIATAVLTLAAAIPWGSHGALSAALGGMVNVISGAAYGWWVTRSEARTAGDVLLTMFKGWALKVLLIVVLLGMVLVLYGDIVHAAFIAAFVVTVGVFAAAVAVGEPGEDKIHH